MEASIELQNTLRLSQPAISANIKKLEEDLGSSTLLNASVEVFSSPMLASLSKNTSID
jgi:hypothetical protein